MKMQCRPLAAAVALCLLLAATACSTSGPRSLAYFPDLGAEGVLPQGGDYEIRLAPDDELEITISSSQPDAVAMYNAPVVTQKTRGDVNPQSALRVHTYVVDHRGEIELPVIGRLNVQGKTTSEVEQMIVARVKSDVRDAFVTVRMTGFQVNVMGEVREPRRLNVTTQRFTVLDALAAAGDLTEYGDRKSLLVIRQEGNEQKYHRLDLTDSKLFSSPYYYLKQNDVVYVEPNDIKTENSKYNQNNAYKLSVISTVVSASSVIVSLIIALAIK